MSDQASVLRGIAADENRAAQRNILELAAETLERLLNENFALAVEMYRLRCGLHDIAEEWAGAECGEPVYAQEAYAIGLAQRMARIAYEALKGHT